MFYETKYKKTFAYYFFLTVRKYVMKGKAPVDPECVSKVNSAHVFSEGSTIWDCMLNQVRILDQCFTKLRGFNSQSR